MASGKSVKTTMFTARRPSRVEQPFGNVDHQGPAGARRSRVTKRKGISPPLSRTSRSLAGLASTARDRAQFGPVDVEDLRADQLVHPELPGDLDGLGLELDAPQALGLRSVDDALELHDPAVAGTAAPTRP